MHIKEYILNKKRLIDKALDRYLPSTKQKPQIIHKAMRYAVFSGGKRIRPILTLASFETCGGKDRSIMQVSCAIELIHTYTLIHDDLPCMDNDDYRRGRSSCHKKFNEALALLAGDALLSLSFQLLSKSDNVDIVNEVSKAIGTRGTIGGQVVDIISTTHGSRLTGHDLDYIASHKTGALFEVATKVGAIFRKVSKRKVNLLSNFGRDIGITFQLIDDLIDRDGYFKIYGADYIKERALFLTKRAKSNLSLFGKDAHRLIEIADLILERRR